MGIILTDTRVSSSRSLALHSPQKHLAVPRLGNHNNPVKKSLPPLQLQESLDISKKTYQKKDERHLHRPIRGRSGLTRSGRVPIKKPPQKHQSPRRISTASRYFLRKRARCAGGASGGGGPVGAECRPRGGSQRVHVGAACTSSEGFNLYAFSSPTSAAGRTELSRLRPYLSSHPN